MMKTILKLLMVSSLLAGYIVLACRSSEGVEPNNLPADHLILQNRKAVEISAGIIVTADSVQVIDCPPNMDCSGPVPYAMARLTVSGNIQVKSVRLSAVLPNYSRKNRLWQDSVALELNGQRYKVILRDGIKSTGRTPQQVIVQVSPL